MTNEQFKSLHRSDIVRHNKSGSSFIVDACYGTFVIAVRTIYISNPSEWILCDNENDKEDANCSNERYKFKEDFKRTFEQLRDERADGE